MKIFLLALCLIFSTFLFAQEKYIMLKPLTWDELQLYQLDSLKTADELKLASHCPSTLKKIQSTFKKTTQHFQDIHGTKYIWTEYINFQGLKCIVKHQKIDSITSNNEKIINPNEYELLNPMQSRILKSASQGIGLKNKDYYKKIRQANLHNNKIKSQPYEKYGGFQNLSIYMKENKPTFKIDKEYLKSLTTKDKGTITSRKIPLYKLFELQYSKEQQQELIE
ncbi:MAG: hypothetical protein AB8B80_14340, partial [Marinicellaceae bacterium]